jgi:NAD-dependent dihydropyrimidine dehydrogenase PreA subunit
MDQETKEYFRKKHWANQAQGFALMRKLQSELEEECVAKGGHDFYEWTYDPHYTIGGDTAYTHRRMCSACELCETKIEEK